MKRNPENLLRHEIVGLDVVIAASSNPSVRGLGGRIVDETQKTITIETDKKVRKIIKEECTFRFSLKGGGAVQIDGSELIGRPQDRIKRKKA